jgi:hypothetical protein
VLGPRDADHEGMQRIAGFIVAVIVINVLVRVVPFGDLPSISLPDLPGWVHTVLHVKNFALIGVVVLVIVGAAVDQRRKAPR